MGWFGGGEKPQPQQETRKKLAWEEESAAGKYTKGIEAAQSRLSREGTQLRSKVVDVAGRQLRGESVHPEQPQGAGGTSGGKFEDTNKRANQFWRTGQPVNRSGGE